MTARASLQTAIRICRQEIAEHEFWCRSYSEAIALGPQKFVYDRAKKEGRTVPDPHRAAYVARLLAERMARLDAERVMLASWESELNELEAV